MLKVIVQSRYGLESIDPASNLAVGAVAGVINVLMTTPLWAVSTRLAVQAKHGLRKGSKPYLGMIDGLSRMYRREGLLGMWKSVVPNLILVSNPTIHFFVYERVRIIMSRIAKRRGSGLNSLEFFMMGAIAKTVATFLTYPLQVVQSQLRNDAKNSKGKQKYKGTFDCLIKIYQVAGLPGWFRGLFAKLWQTVLTAAFQFMTYEKLRVVVKSLILSVLLVGRRRRTSSTSILK
jgi:solute carrier family 25 (peroxisomal adenine nucleotide transporter), member 17